MVFHPIVLVQSLTMKNAVLNTIFGDQRLIEMEIDDKKVRDERVAYKTLYPRLKKVVDLLNTDEFAILKQSSIYWDKETTYDENGKVVNFHYSKPHIALGYKIQKEAEVKKLEDALYQFLGDKSLFEISRHPYDNKATFEFSVDILRKELAKHNLQEAQMVYNKSASFEWDNQSKKMDGWYSDFRHENIINPTKMESVQSFTQECKEIINSGLYCLQMHCYLSKGDKFSLLRLKSFLLPKSFQSNKGK
jgi:hypothetical protein